MARLETVDPATATAGIERSIQHATCLKLVGYPDRAGVAGTRLIPEAAIRHPRVSRDGRTYEFVVRDGLRFSNGESVSARSFERALVRVGAPKLFSPGRRWIREVEGASALAAGRATRLSGVRARGNRLTIRLVEPVADFATRLSMSFFCAIPRQLWGELEWPGSDNVPLPSAGPYFVESWRRGWTLVLKRNPYYRGPRLRRLHAIVFELRGSSATSGVERTERNELDWAGYIPPASHAELAARYGVNRGRYRVHPSGQLRYIALHLASPFADPGLRRAVNAALDRAALAASHGPHAVTPTEQFLTASLPGYRNVNAQSLRPDPNARRFGDGRGARVYLRCEELNPADCVERSRRVQRDLSAVGLDVVPVLGIVDPSCPRPGFHMSFETRPALAAGSVDFLRWLFEFERWETCSTQFAPPARLRRHERLRGAARLRAVERFDADLARSSTWVIPYGVDNHREFFSSRVGCVTFHPIYGLDLATLCLR